MLPESLTRVQLCRGSGHGGMCRTLAAGRWFLCFAASVLANAAVPAETPCPRLPGLGRQPAERSRPCRDLQPCTIPAAGNQVYARTQYAWACVLKRWLSNFLHFAAVELY